MPYYFVEIIEGEDSYWLGESDYGYIAVGRKRRR